MSSSNSSVATGPPCMISAASLTSQPGSTAASNPRTPESSSGGSTASGPDAERLLCRMGTESGPSCTKVVGGCPVPADLWGSAGWVCTRGSKGAITVATRTTYHVVPDANSWKVEAEGEDYTDLVDDKDRAV